MQVSSMGRISLSRILKGMALVVTPLVVVVGWGGPAETIDAAQDTINLVMAGTSYEAASWITLRNIALPAQISYGIFSLGVLGWTIIGQTREIVSPKRNWLKLVDAPFALAHREEYVAQAPSWTPVFLELSMPGGRSPRLTATPESTSKADAAAIDGMPLNKAGIEWNYNRFFLIWSDDRSVRKHTVRPWEIKDQPRPDYLSDGTWRLIQADLDLTWMLLCRGLNEVIASGQVIVWAKVGSASAQRYMAVTPDAWMHYQIKDWPTGLAVSDGGDRLYSIHIEPRTKMT